MITFYTQIIWIHSPRAYAKETLLERFKYPDTLKYKVCPDAPPKTNLEPGTWKSRTPLEKEKYHETSTRPNHQFLKIVGFQNLVFRYIPYITVVNKKNPPTNGTFFALTFHVRKGCSDTTTYHHPLQMSARDGKASSKG